MRPQHCSARELHGRIGGVTHKLKKGGRKALQGLAEELRCRPKSEQQSNCSKTPGKDFSSEILKRQTVRRKDLRRLAPVLDTEIYIPSRSATLYGLSFGFSPSTAMSVSISHPSVNFYRQAHLKG